LDYIGKRGATVGVTREKRIKYVYFKTHIIEMLCYLFYWLLQIVASINCFISFILFSGMQKKFFKKRCCLMLVLESTVKLKKLTILGMLPTFIFEENFGNVQGTNLILSCVLLLDTSFIGFFFVHLAEDQKMIGIIMETKGLTLLVLYLGACSEWFVLMELGGFNFF